ncbi:tail fiber assembly protein [Pseudenterobacter timonensis]|uniref:Tail fiber assembly protein n=1 Tax=Pseudenterobacter timonensis TaxID=1755099 RepID=A0AAE4DL36_9ENTR|nr:tail fiber assembly protein [Pseudenterobacter timonensis]MDR9889522.1 tail fiber assembly protein [Pseudenterobacter timonensis]
MKIWFSAELDAFFQSDWFTEQPGGTIEITPERFEELMQLQSSGLKISHDENGNPIAVEPPPPTKEEAVGYAEQQKAAFLAVAQETISLWQTELQLDIISDEDKASLIEWLDYIKKLQAIDTSKAPGIYWPPVPGHK